MSDHLNTDPKNNPELTVAERKFIAAYRVGDLTEIARMLGELAAGSQAEEAATQVQTDYQPPERLTDHQIIQAFIQDTPDVATRIASFVVGRLILSGYLTTHPIFEEMASVIEDVAEAVSYAIQRIDIITLSRLHDGKPE